MGKKVIEYVIAAVDKTRDAINSARERLSAFGWNVAKNLMNIQAGFQMAFAVISRVSKLVYGAVKEAFRFETLTVQFKTLMKDVDAAREHMAMLKRLGDTPPFSLEQFAAASRSLMVMTDNVLGAERSLVMMGDAAAATGNDIGQVSHAVGRAYAIIRDGQPITRATMELRNMGLITPALAAELDELQKSGATNIEMWDKLEASLQRFEGAMDDTLETGDGMTEALKTEWTNAVRSVGEVFQETSKKGIGSMLGKLKEFNESGAIKKWADSFIDGFNAILAAAKKAWEWMSNTWFGEAIGKAAESIKNTGVQVGAWTTYVAARATGSDAETAKLAKDIFYASHASGRTKDAAVTRLGFDPVEQERAQNAEAQHVREMLKREEAQTAELDRQVKLFEERIRIEDSMARAQRITNEIANTREAIKLLTASDQSSRTRLSAAQMASQQAWGWFRDRGSLAEAMKEERREARAQQRFEQQFQSLQQRIPDWREAQKLTLRDEAVRRVALAREAEQKEAKTMEEIAENTRNLDEMLRELLTMK